MIKRIVLLMRVIVICCLTLTAAYGEAACDVDTLAASVVRLAVYDENGGSLGTGSGMSPVSSGSRQMATSASVSASSACSILKDVPSSRHATM